MRKFHLLFCLIACLLTACNSNKSTENRIMVTIEPQRFLAEQLASPFFTIETMVPNGNSPETYDPTPNQMVQLSGCKAYWAIGDLGFEHAWLRKIKENFPDLRFYRTSQNITPIINVIPHGDHTHDVMDPHVWTSPKEMKIIARNMYESLLVLDPDNKEAYIENFENLQNKIAAIDQEVERLLENSSQKAFIIYHPTLSYFARDYGLKQYSIEADGKEPSPELLKQIVQAVQDDNIQTIFIQEEFDKKNAETIAKETGANLVVIDPLSYNWEEEMLKIVRALSNE